MENQDIYKELAEEIERLILPICQCRQENTNLSTKDFMEKCLSHELRNIHFSVTTNIYNYLQKYKYKEDSLNDEKTVSKRFYSRIDTEQFMLVFDACLKAYQQQGKTFLNLFMYSYSQRTQDAKEFYKNNPKYKIFVDEKKCIFKHGRVESSDEATYDKDDNPNKITSHQDKQAKADYQEKEQTSGISVIYEYAARKLDKDDFAYFRYYITSQLLLLYVVSDKKISSVFQANWGDDIAILFSEKVTDEKLFPYIDLNFFYEQKEMTHVYLEEFQKEKEASGKKMQEKAYVKAKYQAAIARRLGMKSDRMRTKENKRLAFMSEMSKYLHIG